MQNNVTELTAKLLRALDDDYNVIDMPEVVDIISLLEKVAITKELLETTRLGKHVNELRRKTNNAELSRRAKELLKKWRSMVLPEANGQIKSSPPLQQPPTRVTPTKISPPFQGQTLKPRVSPGQQTKVSPPMLGNKMVSPALSQRLVSPGLPNQRLVSPGLRHVSPGLQIGRHVSPGLQMHRTISPGLQGQQISPPLTAGQNADVNLNQVKSKKRPAKEALMDSVVSKRAKLNGGVTDLDFSDNSNSSFKDVIQPVVVKPEVKRDVIVINSDSNSSFAERTGDPLVDQQQPKKRGRKKGSKNHKNLLDEAETSFTNKLAVSASRGNSKVKTTQELLASIQNKNSVLNTVLKPKEDLEEKAAKLTERVSIIDQKLNANTHRNKNSQRGKLALTNSSKNERVIESGSVINDKSLLDKIKEEEDEIVVVDDIEPESESKSESPETEAAGDKEEEVNVPRSLTIEECMALLPPIDKSVLLEVDPNEPPTCTCYTVENKPDFSVDDEEIEERPPFELILDPECPAKKYLEEKYQPNDVSTKKIAKLHEFNIQNVTGNLSLGPSRPKPDTVDGLYENVVPSIYELLDKDFESETFKKYSVSEGGGCTSDNIVNKEEDKESGEKTEDRESSDIRTEEKEVFREWYECVDRPSYNGETIRLLPYCIVD